MSFENDINYIQCIYSTAIEVANSIRDRVLNKQLRFTQEYLERFERDIRNDMEANKKLGNLMNRDDYEYLDGIFDCVNFHITYNRNETITVEVEIENDERSEWVLLKYLELVDES